MAGMSWFSEERKQTELVKRSMRHQPGDGLCFAPRLALVLRLDGIGITCVDM